ncbi:MAG: purine-binding chemotaxis protein CheW [Cognaticolwellia sp.]|jgi:purine-binding chemotaxis protein CheW
MFQAQATQAGPREAHSFLTFFIGQETYGVQIEAVREIIGVQPITPLPDVPSHIVGVINLRGRVIPVMCVRTRIGLEKVPTTSRTCIVVVKSGDDTVGLMVDTVSEVLEIPDCKVDTPPRVGLGSKHFLKGLGHDQDNVRLIIDLPVLLGQPTAQAA